MSFQTILDNDALLMLPKVANLIRDSAGAVKDSMIYCALRYINDSRPCLQDMNKPQKSKLERIIIKHYEGNGWIERRTK